MHIVPQAMNGHDHDDPPVSPGGNPEKTVSSCTTRPATLYAIRSFSRMAACMTLAVNIGVRTNQAQALTPTGVRTRSSCVSVLPGWMVGEEIGAICSC